MSNGVTPAGRRRERVVGSLVVLVGLVVAVLSVLALLDARSSGSAKAGATVTLPSDTASPSATPATSSSTGSPTTGSPATSGATSASAGVSGAAGATRPALVVLNNTTRTGLAQQAAATFTQGGWTVTSTGNLTQDILSTCAYYDPDVAGAQAAATALMRQFPAIARTKEKFGGLPAGPIVVVLTADYTG